MAKRRVLKPETDAAAQMRQSALDDPALTAMVEESRRRIAAGEAPVPASELRALVEARRNAIEAAREADSGRER